MSRLTKTKFQLKCKTFVDYLQSTEVKINDLSQENNSSARKKATVFLEQIDVESKAFDLLVDSFEGLATLPEGLTEENFEVTVAKIRSSFRKLIFECRVYVIDDDKPTASSTRLSFGNNATNLNSTIFELPQIKLPHFDGKYTNYSNFKAEFDSIVGNNESITDAQKFKYLKCCLNQDALNLVRHLETNDSNYKIAISILDERFQCHKQRIRFHCGELLTLPSVQSKNAESIRQLCDKFNSHFNSLKAIAQNDVFETIYSYYILSKLDPTLRLEVERKQNGNVRSIATKDIISLLANTAQDLEAANFSQRSFEINTKTVHKRTSLVVSVESETPFCFLCKRNHFIHNCPLFLEKRPQERFQIIKNSKRCTNCLNNHTFTDCTSKYLCKHCQSKHHTLLHFGKFTSNQEQPLHRNLKPIESVTLENSLTPEIGNNTSTLCVQDSTTTVLLATSLVRLQVSPTNYVVVRAILDSASHVSFITEHCAQRLGCIRQKAPLAIAGVKDSPVNSEGFSLLSLTTLTGSLILKNHPFVILNRITSDLPRKAITPHLRSMVESYVLADPSFDTCGPIDCLLGADVYASVVTGAPISLGNNLPVLLNTRFGFVLLGKAPTINPYDTLSTHLSTLTVSSDENLSELLKKFWKIEEPPAASKLSEEEQECEQFYSSTTTRLTNGRYQVRLPFKRDLKPLGDSYTQAHRRFLSLENRLSSDPILKQQYVEGMRDYINQGHMRLLESNILPAYYIPHLGVHKQNGDSAKLRIVFDCSCRTTSGESLNSILMTGPKLQSVIQDIIVMFRLYPYVFTCDIKQMFRQIELHPQDQRYLCVLWREDSSKPLQTYCLTTVTFGVTCSPYQAIRTLHQLAKDDGHLYPLASKIIMDNSFVDDFCIGAHTLAEAKVLRQQLTDLCARGGFSFGKWSSNSPEFLQDIPPEERRCSMLSFSSLEPSPIGVLGLLWDPVRDHFTYDLAKLSTSISTASKRSVLSTIAKIYDTCGYISPYVMSLKIFIQSLWLLKQDWDDPLPDNLFREWTELLSTLPYLSKIKIPRFSMPPNVSSYSLHGFADASSKGYAAVIYLKGDNVSGSFLIFAKTKVAPLRTMTIPRLELLGAHMLAQIMNHCTTLLKKYLTLSSVYLWTDSTIVLSWIRTSPHVLKTFTANRVSQILEWTNPEQWRHVPSEWNPADIASRGISAASLVTCDTWWYGPSYLDGDPATWPVSNNEIVPHLGKDEFKETKTVCLNAIIPDLDIFSHISSWPTLLRVVSRIMTCFSKQTIICEVQKLRRANLALCYYIQRNSFATEFQNLEKGRNCHKSFERLKPFIDDCGLIRVGGRLAHSNEPYDVKHPILLPKNHRLVSLMVDYYHHSLAHAGLQYLITFLSKRFWIMSVKQLIRSRIYNCMRCFHTKPTHSVPLMGDLPPSRVVPSLPFSQTGMDFAGPFHIKSSTLRKAPLLKLYTCIYICMATKAIHIELVSDLSTSAFIASLQRFINRRGCPNDIYSDCGTNFKGASNQLSRDFHEFLSSETLQFSVRNFTTLKEIRFHFLPPNAPHQGGLWERAVQSMKRHLNRVLGNHVPTYEEFLTLCVRIEGILNSRPLTPLSMNSESFDVLTPGHFLIGRPITQFPETDYTHVPVNRLRNFQMIQAFTRQFWNKWRREYLISLQKRTKWFKDTPNLLLGDMVLMEEPNVPPLSWPLGRILETYSGKDGVVRSAKIRTAHGEYVRPVIKLFKLPMDEESTAFSNV